MDEERIIEKLHKLERKVLPLLKETTSFEEIVRKSNLDDIEVMRALQWLQNKALAKIKKKEEEIIQLDENGKKYSKEGLPEVKILNTIKEREKSIQEIEKQANLNKEEIQAAIGVLKRKAAIEILKQEGKLIIKINENGKKLLQRMPEQEFLKKQFPIKLSELNEFERFIVDNLKKRKNIISIEKKKEIIAELTEIGKKIASKHLELDVVDKLNKDLIISGKWKEKKLRAYDVTINVPKTHPGRKQFYRRFLDELRQRFIALGFEEMTSPLVETEFWDMDALFMPQFHSARDIHEGYYVKEPEYGMVNEKILKKVKEAHEKGVLGSKGWQYKFDVKRTKRLILRTQGTACSARKLASKDLKIPGKYFAIVRCFRYDVIDATHLPDFNQVEGIVIGKELNIKHLFKLLKDLAKEVANAKKVRLVPGYFPFTEPSAELFAFHEDLGWLELGGAGIFRPELVYPLTGRKDIKVIAWGLGIDRIAMLKAGINDIRQLFSHDLEFLRNVKVV